GQHTYFHDYLPCKHWPSKKGPSYPGGSNPMCCRWVIFNVLLTPHLVLLDARQGIGSLKAQDRISRWLRTVHAPKDEQLEKDGPSSGD
ncbi:hypothetical protein KTF37_28295, partial [Burkholderia multivorans]|nr:hypothetical protein [Burkholderia multivorans]